MYFRLSIFFFVIAIVSFLVGCRSRVFDEKEIYTFLNDESNGYTLSRTINDIDIKVAAKPVDLIAIQEVRMVNEKQIRDSIFLSNRKIFSKYCYFSLSLSHNGKEITTQNVSGMPEFQNRILNMSYKMNDYVFITTENKDTIRSIDYVYERTYGYGPASSFLFVFERDKILKHEKVIFNVIDIGLGLGNNKFQFDNSIFINEPQLGNR